MIILIFFSNYIHLNFKISFTSKYLLFFYVSLHKWFLKSFELSFFLFKNIVLLEKNQKVSQVNDTIHEANSYSSIHRNWNKVDFNSNIKPFALDKAWKKTFQNYIETTLCHSLTNILLLICYPTFCYWSVIPFIFVIYYPHSHDMTLDPLDLTQQAQVNFIIVPNCILF